MKKNIFACIVCMVLLLNVSCSHQATGGVQSSISEKGDIKNIKVIANQANIRQGCSTDSNVIQNASKNSILDVVSEVSDWYAVKLANNQIGFIQKNESKPVVVDDKNTTPSDTPEPSKTPPSTTSQNTPGTNTPKIPDTSTNQGGLSEQEQQMVQLVNKARAENNLPALKVDTELANVARIKSQDMIDNNYFSHNSPTYGSPFDMMKDFGINYVQAGENIAGNQDVQKAHEALMNSPGHRKNILSPDFTHIGIGIRKGGQYGNMYTQMFISKPQ